MPRAKRKNAENTTERLDVHTPEGPVATAAEIDGQEEPTNDVAQAFAEAGLQPASTIPQPEQNGNGHEGNGEQEPPRRLVRETFTSKAAGVFAVEDKRFNLPRVGIDFADDKRATDEEKADLKAAGLRYDPRDKGYTAIANRDTRQARDELAQKFTDRRLKEKAEQADGQER